MIRAAVYVTEHLELEGIHSFQETTLQCSLSASKLDTF